MRTSGNDGFDGSAQYPFATVGRALQEAAAEQAAGNDWMYVAMGPGDWVANISIDIPIGVRIEGCSRDETRISSASPTQAVFAVQPGNDVILAGIEIAGGAYGVTVQDALTALDTARVRGATRVGVAAEGQAGRVRLLDTEVLDITCADGSGCGWGVSASQAEVDLRDSVIRRATEFGVVTYHSDVTVLRTTVEDTRKNAGGEYGRAAQLQWGNQQVVDSSFYDNHDASLLSLLPDGLIIGNIAIDITGIGLHGRGDSLVVAGRPGTTTIDLSDSSFSRADRLPVVLQNLNAEINGNSLANNGLADLMYLQGTVTVTGTDGSLTVNVSPIDLDLRIIRPSPL